MRCVVCSGWQFKRVFDAHEHWRKGWRIDGPDARWDEKPWDGAKQNARQREK